MNHQIKIFNRLLFLYYFVHHRFLTETVGASGFGPPTFHQRWTRYQLRYAPMRIDANNKQAQVKES